MITMHTIMINKVIIYLILPHRVQLYKGGNSFKNGGAHLTVVKLYMFTIHLRTYIHPTCKVAKA